MIALEKTQDLPLTLTDDGSIRISSSSVTLESVIFQHEHGASPEQIQESFPSLKLADIYAVISYYLNHRERINQYLLAQEKKAKVLREDIESDPVYRSTVTEFRERIKTRYRSRRQRE